MSPTPHTFSCNLYSTATLSVYIQYTDSKADELTCRGIAEVGGDGSGVDAPRGRDQGTTKKREGGVRQNEYLNENPAFSALNAF